MTKDISSDLVGETFDPIPTSWNSKDTMLYALGVGANATDDLDFVYEGRGPKVLPTFGVIPGMLSMAGMFGKITVNPLMILHGEQGITCHRAIPPDASAQVTGKVAAIWDKGKAAVLVVEGETSDADGPLFTTRSSIFVRGAGGFGGERGPSANESNIPDRKPDEVVVEQTRPEQAALYRLSGDRNPLHVDPDFAQAAGFDKPFIHGLCTYGFVGRALLSTFCDRDPSKFKSLDGRFAERVYPGDTITTEFWDLGEGKLVLQASTHRGVVLSQATAEVKN
ncbi:MAG: 3-alpha,7-alpha,12-alpha-trihydroxy-5-beta-cholest-24-enoyl-CoA hydratase [Acidimicrobiales bacterium]|nr:3-alpha,7-alpha,12-alpha-trihydroxy-5-beta-cholest-24-enoyl-CoA hydratase [Acidimicrobiales bacterium]